MGKPRKNDRLFALLSPPRRRRHAAKAGTTLWAFLRSVEAQSGPERANIAQKKLRSLNE